MRPRTIKRLQAKLERAVDTENRTRVDLNFMRGREGKQAAVRFLVAITRRLKIKEQLERAMS